MDAFRQETNISCNFLDCARKFTRHVIHRARARAKQENKQMIGKMAIATALRGFNDLVHSVTPTFLSKKRFYLQ